MRCPMAAWYRSNFFFYMNCLFLSFSFFFLLCFMSRHELIGCEELVDQGTIRRKCIGLKKGIIWTIIICDEKMTRQAEPVVAVTGSATHHITGTTRTKQAIDSARASCHARLMQSPDRGRSQMLFIAFGANGVPVISPQRK